MSKIFVRSLVLTVLVATVAVAQNIDRFRELVDTAFPRFDPEGVVRTGMLLALEGDRALTSAYGQLLEEDIEGFFSSLDDAEEAYSEAAREISSASQSDFFNSLALNASLRVLVQSAALEREQGGDLERLLSADSPSDVLEFWGVQLNSISLGIQAITAGESAEPQLLVLLSQSGSFKEQSTLFFDIPFSQFE